MCSFLAIPTLILYVFAESVDVFVLDFDLCNLAFQPPQVLLNFGTFFAPLFEIGLLFTVRFFREKAILYAEMNSI
jgi:hypothetical protein